MVKAGKSKAKKIIAIAARKFSEWRNLVRYKHLLGPTLESLTKRKDNDFELITDGTTRLSDEITKLFDKGWGLLP